MPNIKRSKDERRLWLAVSDQARLGWRIGGAGVYISLPIKISSCVWERSLKAATLSRWGGLLPFGYACVCVYINTNTYGRRKQVFQGRLVERASSRLTPTNQICLRRHRNLPTLLLFRSFLFFSSGNFNLASVTRFFLVAAFSDLGASAQEFERFQHFFWQNRRACYDGNVNSRRVFPGYTHNRWTAVEIFLSLMAEIKHLTNASPNKHTWAGRIYDFLHLWPRVILTLTPCNKNRLCACIPLFCNLVCCLEKQICLKFLR